MRLAAIASALAIVLCVAVFGGIFYQKASILAPASTAAPEQVQTTPTEGRAPGSVTTVADNAADSAMAAPVVVAQAAPAPAAPAAPLPSAASTSCSNPNALGIARVVEIDTTGGPGFGFEHFKSHDFLREGEVVLTFDDGPWPKNTPAVLAALAVHWAVGGPTAPYFRFPALRQPQELIEYLGKRNIAIFSTDMDSFDFKMRKPEQVRQSVMEKLKKHGKGIVLVHDFQHATAEAAGDLLNDLKAGGYKIVFMKPKYSVTTIASYDETILKQVKGSGGGDARPTSSVVRTISQ